MYYSCLEHQKKRISQVTFPRCPCRVHVVPLMTTAKLMCKGILLRFPQYIGKRQVCVKLVQNRAFVQLQWINNYLNTDRKICALHVENFDSNLSMVGTRNYQ